MEYSVIPCLGGRVLTEEELRSLGQAEEKTVQRRANIAQLSDDEDEVEEPMELGEEDFVEKQENVTGEGQAGDQEKKSDTKSERTGVTHLVHCWFAQGQDNVSH